MELQRKGVPAQNRRVERRRSARSDERGHVSHSRRSVVVLIGELDFSDAPAIRELLLIAGDSPVIDMLNVGYMDAGAINEFVRLAKRAAPQRVVLLRPQRSVRRMIEILGLQSLFIISNDGAPRTALRHVWRSDVATF